MAYVRPVYDRKLRPGDPRRRPIGYEVRYRDGDGVQRTKGGFRRRRDADAWASDLETSRHQGTLVPHSQGSTRLVDVADEWLASIQDRRRPKTVDGYEKLLNVHVRPAFGRRSVGSITYADADRLVRSIEAIGRRPATARNAFFVLKMVLFWILIPVFVFIVGPTNVVRSGGDWGTAIASTMANLWSGLFIAAGVITLVFAILERTHAQMGTECKWDPMKLPAVRKERKTSVFELVCELAFNWFGLIWLLLVPHNPFLLFGPAAAFLRPGSLWDTFYIPVVAVSCFAIFRIAFALSKPQWTWLPPLGQLVQSLLGLVIVKYMLAAAGRITPGQWHPFVVLRDRASAPIEYVHVASVVNGALYISLICVWIGLCIAIATQTWKFMRQVRKGPSTTGQPAPLQVH